MSASGGATLSRVEATPRRRDRSFICRDLLAAGGLLFIPGTFSVVSVLFFQVLLFGPAALPAILPVLHQELEAKSVDLEARLEADA